MIRQNYQIQRRHPDFLASQIQIEEVDEDNVSSPSPDKDEDYIKQEDENGSFVLESDSSNEGIVEQLKQLHCNKKRV